MKDYEMHVGIVSNGVVEQEFTKMRHAIFMAGHDSALIRTLMMSADVQGLSSEDRYTLLAYHALIALENTYRQVMDFSMKDAVGPRVKA